MVGATTWAMSFAQQAFPASTAALAYAMELLFAALFAAGESIHLLQLLGGGLAVLATVVASGSAHVFSPRQVRLTGCPRRRAHPT